MAAPLCARDSSDSIVSHRQSLPTYHNRAQLPVAVCASGRTERLAERQGSAYNERNRRRSYRWNSKLADRVHAASLLHCSLKVFDVSTHAAQLAGLTAVITGASRGIGHEIATQFARAGAEVVLHANRHADAAESLAASIRQQGGQATVLLADLADFDQQDALVERGWQWRGKVDIWVNNAGVDVLTGPLSEASFEEKLARLWQVDVLAAMRLARMVGARMRASSGGVILNVGWDQAATGMAGDSGEMFAATKGAIMAFTRSLAKSLAPSVRVNCLAPGWIRTDWGEQASEYWQERARRDSLRARWGTPADVAQAAVFLASPAADFITGHVLPINGGLAGQDLRTDS
jgi:3-oxoacyl-[acyl-carrier protein] reductase